MEIRERLPAWPYLTVDIPAVSANIRVCSEDFFVEEIPQYLPSGDGTHVYFMVEKKGMSTLDLIRKLANRLGRSRKEFGYAGLKDAKAVTRQIISLEHIDPKEIENLDIPNVKIIWINRHKNKIKLGHLKGNRFKIKFRNVKTDDINTIKQCLEVLGKRGVPNYFGYQRFGVRGDNWILGKAIIKEDYKLFCDYFLGNPIPEIDKMHIKKAREFYDKGKFELAYQVWPKYFADARKALRVLIKNPSNYQKSAMSVDKKLKKLFVSAYQSYLFNNVLSKRLNDIDKVFEGDLAYKHDTGGVFWVREVEEEQKRADRFEISPTGPLYGYRMRFPEGKTRAIEEEILQEEGLSTEDFKKVKGHKVKGGRRPLRVPIIEMDIKDGKDENGYFIELSFSLPSGSYATAVLREILKENLKSEIKKGS